MRITPAIKRREPVVTYKIDTDIQTEVVSLAEAKAFMQIDFNDFDSLITDLIKAAREEAELYTGLSIGEREITVSGTPEGWEQLDPYYPFAPITEKGEDGFQKVGYSPETCPSAIMLAIKNIVHAWFNKRDGSMPDVAKNLLARYRRRVGI